jgi:alpha-tubulin suppressor-like RCC1 family protein
VLFVLVGLAYAAAWSWPGPVVVALETMVPGVPGKPAVTAGDGQVTVSWAAPVSDGGASITGYTATSVPEGRFCATGGTLTCTVSGLTNGGSYTFTVAATNTVGTGPASEPSEAVTPRTVPTAPGGRTSNLNTLGVAGAEHACVVVGDGTARCWGANFSGQLGDGTTTSSSTPVTVKGLSNAVAVSTGAISACALLADGTARCWGHNEDGQLGDGTTTRSLTPVTVKGLSNAVEISAGYTHSCALLADGTIRCWGYNFWGQLGNGELANRSLTPVTVKGISDAVAITSGYQHTCALLGDGTARCWGDNANGQLGDGTHGESYDRPTPTPVTVFGLSGAVAINAGTSHTCAVLGNGTARCWGSNWDGQVGNGTTTNFVTSPEPVTGLSNVVAISAGWFHSCATLSDGTGGCWGSNLFGALGDGTATNSSVPVRVVGVSDAVAIGAGGDHFSCAVSRDGTVSCWGRIYGSGGGLLASPGPTMFSVDSSGDVTTSTYAASSSTTFFKGAALPGKPTPVSVTAGDQQVRVAWTIPIFNGGTSITRYTVTASPGGRTCTTSGALSCTVTGLTNGTSYRFTVAARNTVGTGAASVRSKAVTPQARTRSAYAPLSRPARLFESRAGLKTVDGKQQGSGRRGAGSVTEVVVAGRGGVPKGAGSAVLNVTAVNPVSRGFVTVYPCGTRPDASSLNYVPGAAVANGVIAKLSSKGTVCVFTNQEIDLVVDVTGSFP